MVVKRTFDVITATALILVLSPLFVVIVVLIILDSPGEIIYVQSRIGLNYKPFSLFKFRTMYRHADKLGLLTIGHKDHRITRVGYWLRKYKLDELPQLFNILVGDMSFVGPRPEVSKYVKLYNPQQLRVLSVKPGITDWASIKYFDENELLARVPDPENLYITEIMPSKILQNLAYIDERSFWKDMNIIFQTLKRCLGIRN